MSAGPGSRRVSRGSCSPQFDPKRLHGALRQVSPEWWSVPSSFEATGVHHRYRRVVRAGLDPFRFVLDDFAPVRDAWLSSIDPGGYIVPHRDQGPYWERWQVPVSTAGWTDIAGIRVTATDGVPFRVEHWRRHAVGNPTGKPRVHLVIDRDVLVNPAAVPFHVYEGENA